MLFRPSREAHERERRRLRGLPAPPVPHRFLPQAQAESGGQGQRLREEQRQGEREQRHATVPGRRHCGHGAPQLARLRGARERHGRRGWLGRATRDPRGAGGAQREPPVCCAERPRRAGGPGSPARGRGGRRGRLLGLWAPCSGSHPAKKTPRPPAQPLPGLEQRAGPQPRGLYQHRRAGGAAPPCDQLSAYEVTAPGSVLLLALGPRPPRRDRLFRPRGRAGRGRGCGSAAQAPRRAPPGAHVTRCGSPGAAVCTAPLQLLPTAPDCGSGRSRGGAARPGTRLGELPAPRGSGPAAAHRCCPQGPGPSRVPRPFSTAAAARGCHSTRGPPGPATAAPPSCAPAQRAPPLPSVPRACISHEAPRPPRAGESAVHARQGARRGGLGPLPW